MLPQAELDRFTDAIERGDCLLLDVRERREYEAGHLPNARSMPLSQLEIWTSELDKERLLILYCRSGHRARRCAEALSARGFRHVRVLDGGYSAWSARPPK